MKFNSAAQFKSQTNYVITLMGMSGVGKTHWGRLLADEDWFHYSVDYRIGTRYLVENILDELKILMMRDPSLKQLLLSDSIYLAHNLTVDNLALLSQFIGKFGNPQQGGLPANDFLHKQRLYHQAEITAQQDFTDFVDKARHIYSYPHFLNDTTGSLCEIADIDNPNCAVMQNIARHSLLIYLKTSEEDEQLILQRQLKSPKPMSYNVDLFEKLRGKLGDDVHPDDFLRVIFPLTLEYRKARYQTLADNYGYSIDVKHLQHVKNSQDFIDLIAETIDNQPS